MSNLGLSHVYFFFTFFLPKVTMKNAKNKVTWAWSLSWILWFSAREGEKGSGSGVPEHWVPSMRLGTSKSHLAQVPQDRTLCHPSVGPRLPDGWRQWQHAGWKELFSRNLMKLVERDGVVSITALFSWDWKTCKAVQFFYMALPDCNFILKINSSRCACTVGWEDNEQWHSRNQRNTRACSSEAMLQFPSLLLSAWLLLSEKMTAVSFDKVVCSD